MTTQAHNSAAPANWLGPYLAIAGAAFVVGFAAFLLLGWVLQPKPAVADPWQAPVSAPAFAPADIADTHVI